MELSSKVASLYRVQDYGGSESIEGFESVELRRFNDDGGSMTELMRLDGGTTAEISGFRPAQVNYSRVEPGVIKAFHLHKRQTDVWFVPPEDRVLLVVADVRQGSSTEGQARRVMLGHGNSRLVRIPPGVAHGCRNLGERPATIFYFTDLQFSAEPTDCDEGRLPWDVVGADVWETSRE